MSLARSAAALSVSAVSTGALKRGARLVYVVETKSGKLYAASP